MREVKPLLDTIRVRYRRGNGGYGSSVPVSRPLKTSKLPFFFPFFPLSSSLSTLYFASTGEGGSFCIGCVVLSPKEIACHHDHFPPCARWCAGKLRPASAC